MYARVTRFEGSDPAVLRQEIDGMRTQMESGLTDEAIDQMSEQVKDRFERDEVERLLKSIKRTLVLTDSEKGSSAMVLFCDTEDDVRASTRSSTRCRPARAAASARAWTSTGSRSTSSSTPRRASRDQTGRARA
jgi:hypothetical protein